MADGSGPISAMVVAPCEPPRGAAVMARAIRASGRAVLAATTVAAVTPAAYLTVVSLAGLPRRSPRMVQPPVTRFAILVPAHDEAAGIAATLESFRSLDYPSRLFDVHVVADNCSDATAAIVRSHGWHAHERFAPDDPGKGPALNWLHDQLAASGEQVDAFVVIDADTSVDRGFLAAIDVALRNGADVAQGYYSVRDPDASPGTSFRFAALACRHHLRPQGRNRLGASCGLYGNGMAFRAPILSGRRWSGHLVEDAELQNELLLDGHVVRYVPDAVVLAEMPETTEAATSQNQRWERGRIEMAKRYVPRLLARAGTDPRHLPRYVDAVLDHLVPPLSALLGLQFLAATVAAPPALLGVRRARTALALDLMAIGALLGHVVAGLISVRAPRSHVLALVGAPRLVWWKLKLWVGVAAPGTDVAWTRTERNVAGTT